MDRRVGSISPTLAQFRSPTKRHKKTVHYRITAHHKGSRKGNKRSQNRSHVALYYYKFIHLILHLKELNPHLLVRAKYLCEAAFDEDVEGLAKDIRVYCVEFCVRGIVSLLGGKRANEGDTLISSKIPFRYLVKRKYASFLSSVIDLSIPTVSIFPSLPKACGHNYPFVDYISPLLRLLPIHYHRGPPRTFPLYAAFCRHILQKLYRVALLESTYVSY